MSVVLAAAVTVFAVACGGGGGQPQECKDYVACAEKVGGTTKDTAISVYGPSGSCFVGGATQACADACKTSLTSTKTAFPDAGC